MTTTDTHCPYCEEYLEHTGSAYVCRQCRDTYTEAEYDDIATRQRRHIENLVANAIRRWM